MAVRAVSLLFFIGLPALAHGVCVEPDTLPPSCTEQTPQEKRFEDNDEFVACREAVDAYTQALAEWVVCTQEDAKRRAAAAFRQFRCKTRGDTICFKD
jgi:hypothetical protein